MLTNAFIYKRTLTIPFIYSALFGVDNFCHDFFLTYLQNNEDDLFNITSLINNQKTKILYTPSPCESDSNGGNW